MSASRHVLSRPGTKLHLVRVVYPVVTLVAAGVVPFVHLRHTATGLVGIVSAGTGGPGSRARDAWARHLYLGDGLGPTYERHLVAVGVVRRCHPSRYRVPDGFESHGRLDWTAVRDLAVSASLEPCPEDGGYVVQLGRLRALEIPEPLPERFDELLMGGSSIVAYGEDDHVDSLMQHAEHELDWPRRRG